MAEGGASVLAVDDDPLTCRMIEFMLDSEGYTVRIANDPQTAFAEIAREVPDLLLLDVQLPKMDGFTMMRQLKREYSNLPVIMLTARAEMQDRLTGLEGGADDYVVKPFEPAELLARVKAVLRRSKRQLANSMSMIIEENGLTLDIPNLTVELEDGEQVSLTRTEARILQRLMVNPNNVISREDLIAFAGGYIADTYSNQIDVYIGRIRRKLKDDTSDPRYIQTVRGSGYKFVSPTRVSGAASSV